VFETTAPADQTTRLHALLGDGASGLGDEAVAEARALGAELTGEVVTSLVEAELSRPNASGSAVRAVHLAGELRLTGAVPALVRCVDALADPHPLRHAAMAALARLGSESVHALLASFDRCGTIEERARTAEALSRTTVEDDRIRGAFVRMLEDDPVNGARYLAERGEWRAVPDLSRAVDRLALEPVADCGICAGEDLRAIAAAIRVLGGTLTKAQQARIDDVLERGDALWIPFDAPFSSPGEAHAAARGARPARNAAPRGPG
jgi:hypothetical protein